ncbi:hypothetical protein TBLA_0A02210 [Henningerozyma blattae CBS 6284]|uniref:Uncharacterized protein n=1 Tax=Henningerozyma blattae (strain ATCC 34711 / CBS 6284 / DSM 70876 / NBRC 10599 / NRRL Y-10934 / UCD 77-7) TaxID=1071380 RepID=I2GV69_HENB6|nr:hypothetical protein TBLA_0A02210 [Tetrapisispora blattae CBS 6284]CCH58021.1 hypothetical protein TBLA_0A02210 [Tetrapisispora blattae CBS 6284]
MDTRDKPKIKFRTGQVNCLFKQLFLALDAEARAQIEDPSSEEYIVVKNILQRFLVETFIASSPSINVVDNNLNVQDIILNTHSKYVEKYDPTLERKTVSEYRRWEDLIATVSELRHTGPSTIAERCEAPANEMLSIVDAAISELDNDLVKENIVEDSEESDSKFNIDDESLNVLVNQYENGIISLSDTKNNMKDTKSAIELLSEMCNELSEEPQ